jgi:hypothetical protein
MCSPGGAHEAPKASPTSQTLEGETKLEAFLSKKIQWLTTEAAAPTHMYPVIITSKSINSRRESSTRLSWHLLIMGHIIDIAY